MKRNAYFEHDLDHDCNNVGTTIESAEADIDRIALHSTSCNRSHISGDRQILCFTMIVLLISNLGLYTKSFLKKHIHKQSDHTETCSCSLLLQCGALLHLQPIVAARQLLLESAQDICNRLGQASRAVDMKGARL